MGRSRRSLLATVASAAGVVGTAGSAALAGCSTLSGRPEPVRVLAAGSLQRAIDDGLRDAVDAPLAVEARGSAALARLVADGQRDPDVLALADVALFDRVLDDAWHAAFATNALAVATADTPGGRRVRNAAGDADRHWYDPVLAGDAALGRTDPDLDPLGYRTLFAVDLLAAHNDHPGLRDDLLAPDQVYPETALLSTFETGALDAAVVYESMATDHGYDAVDLPPRADLSDPGRADAYAAATYDLPDGGLVRGDAIEYGATLRSTADDAARAVFEELIAGDSLRAHGFEPPDAFPRFTRNAPDALADR
jgi:molybdate/tungstate transport system substrate-binding protein